MDVRNVGNLVAGRNGKKTFGIEKQEPVALPNGVPKEKNCYRDDELLEFKVIIIQKLEKAEADFKMYQSSVSNSDGNGTNDTSPTFKVLEEGEATLSKEEAGRLAVRQQKFIQSLKAALVRIENKTYGICRQTGKLIPKERLRAVPHATLSIEAKCQK